MWQIQIQIEYLKNNMPNSYIADAHEYRRSYLVLGNTPIIVQASIIAIKLYTYTKILVTKHIDKY